MTTTTTLLDRDSLKALRASNDWISFHAMWRDGELVESYIRGSRKDAVGESYTAVQFACPSRLDYGGGLVRDYPVLRAYASVSTPGFHELWQTVLALLRAGDEIRILWSANGQANTHVHEAGLNADTCQLEVIRGNRRLRFHIAESICPSNSARMFTSGENAFGSVHGPSSSYMAAEGPNA